MGDTVQASMDNQINDIIAIKDKGVLRGSEIGFNSEVVGNDVKEGWKIRREILNAVNSPLKWRNKYLRKYRSTRCKEVSNLNTSISSRALGKIEIDGAVC